MVPDTRLLFVFVFRLKSRLVESGGCSPDGGARQRKLTLQEGTSKEIAGNKETYSNKLHSKPKHQ